MRRAVIAGTGSGPAAPQGRGGQEGAQRGLPCSPPQHAGTSLPHPASPAAAAADTPVRRRADLLYNLAPESLCKAPDCAPNDSVGCYKYTKLFVGIFMKFYHRLPWLVMALFMYGLYTWLCSLSKHNSITVFNCSISVVLSTLCFPAQLLNGRGRY